MGDVAATVVTAPFLQDPEEVQVADVPVSRPMGVSGNRQLLL